MSYEDDRALRAAAAGHDAQARGLRRGATFAEADGLWQSGDRGAALRVLYNTGHGDDMVGFCRERGLSESDARAEIDAAQIDWS